MAMNKAPVTPVPRRVTVLGSTGSVGCSTVDLLLRDQESFTVEALTAGSNAALLVKQALGLRPAFVALADPAGKDELEAGLAGTGIEVAVGPQAVIEAAERPADWVMAAIVGAAGLSPTLAAIRRGAIVALANKECLVCAGDLVMAETQRSGATLLPVDSEHSAIYQVFDFERRDGIERIILTASGGPFRTFDKDRLARVTPEEALQHPNWSMGAKVTIDSATLMNKGLELIEAFHLFPVGAHQLEAVVHPQSVVHCLVMLEDGSVMAQLSHPDMRTPIALALSWPERLATPVARLDLVALGSLSFEAPDHGRFPALKIAVEALNRGGAAPAVLNAANEVAVTAFLERRIGFMDIAPTVAACLEKAEGRGLINAVQTLDDVLAVDGEARIMARTLLPG